MSRLRQFIRLTLFVMFVLFLQVAVSPGLYTREVDAATGLGRLSQPDTSPISFTVQAPAGPFAVGEEISLAVTVAGTASFPLSSVQLDLPRHTAVRYTAGPGIPSAGIGSGTLNLGDLAPKDTLPLTIRLRLETAAPQGVVELPLQLRAAGIDPTIVTVQLPVTAIAGDEAVGAGETEPEAAAMTEPAPWQFTYTPPGSSSFTGAATYSYPIPVPPGIGGLTPSLVIAYNSRGIESYQEPVASDGFGAGWGMPQAEITNGNAARMFDPLHQGGGCPNFWDSLLSLSINGTTYNLKSWSTNSGRHGRYTALGDPSLYVEYKNDGTENVTGEYWLVRTPEGTEYIFGRAEHAEQAVGPLKEDCITNNDQPRNSNEFIALSWKLESITDVYGHQVHYTYGTACHQDWNPTLGDFVCHRFPLDANTPVQESYIFPSPPPSQPPPYTTFRREVDVALDRIEYNFVNSVPQSEVKFSYSGWNWDAVRSEEYMSAGHYRPGSVVISQGGQTVGAYVFTYDQAYHYDPPRDLSTTFWWLTGITPYGSDYTYTPSPPQHNGTALPAQTLAYEQNTDVCAVDVNEIMQCVPVLTMVDNGYGGVSRFVYDRYNNAGQTQPDGKWFVVKEIYTWDGVSHEYGQNPVAMSRLVYNRAGFTACYDVGAPGTTCRSLLGEPTESLVGFNGVTIDTQTHNGLAWTTLSRNEAEFDTTTYWLNGKTLWQRQLDPNTGAELTEESFTWELAGPQTADAQLTRQDHYVYAGETLHTFETFTYLNGTGNYGALHEKREYGKDIYGGDVLHRCTQYDYAHQTAGTVWLVNHVLRQTLYDGNCGPTRLAETLYRYDNPTSPADTDLDDKAALEWTLTWVGEWPTDNRYVSSHLLNYPASGYPAYYYGLPWKTESFSDYSTNLAFASSVRSTATVTGYTPLGVPTGTQTSATGLPTLSQGITYDAAFPWLPASTTDANNDTTGYRYDLFGRLIKLIRPGDSDTNPTLRYRYWDEPTYTGGTLFIKPLLVETIYKDNLQEGVRQFYDGLGRLVQSQAARSEIRYGSDSFGQRDVLTTNGYDARGLLVCQSVPHDIPPYYSNGSSPYHDVICSAQPHTNTQYDLLARVEKVLAPDGTLMQTHHYGVTTMNGVFETYHDVIDANRHRTQQNYDTFGRLAKVYEMSGNCGNYWPGFECEGIYIEPWAVYATTDYTYDRRDQLTQVVDEAGNQTSMTYDALGRKLTMDDPDMGEWQYHYDAAGNLARQFDARSNALCFYYDNYNRLSVKSQELNSTAGESCAPLPPATGHPDRLASYTYDETAGGNNGLGRLTRVDDHSGYHTFVYDDRGRASSESRLINGNPTPYTMQYAYDALDRLTHQTYPNGEVVTTTYNTQGLPEGLSGSNIYVDAAQYNRTGQMKILDLGNGLKTYYGYNGYEGFGQHDIYDALNVTWSGWEDWYGNLWRICTAPDASSHCQAANKDLPLAGQRMDLRYSFDAAGNVDQIRDYVNANQVQTFSYDHRNRLIDAATGATGSGQYQRDYTYDELGNFLTRAAYIGAVGVDVAYYYHDPAHPHAVTSLQAWDESGAQPSGATYEYDANGNTIRSSDWNNSDNYLFDAENRLVQVARTGTPTCSGLSQEGEYGAITGRFEEVNDPATSAGRYVHTPNGTGNRLAPDEGQKVTYCFHVATAGTYRLKGWVYAPNDNDDSFFVKINGSPGNGYYWEVANNTTYQADYLNDQNTGTDPVAFYLAAGTHTITVYLREDGARLDRMELELQGPHTANVTHFTYDTNGQRMKTVEPSGKVIYDPFPGYEETVDGATEVTIRRLTYSLGGQAIAVRKQVVGGANTLHYIHTDHLGSTSLATSSTGSLVSGSTTRYYPFGDYRTQPTAGVTDRGFTGHQSNNEGSNDLGLIYMNARYYAPGLARFLSADTLVPDPANPQSYNRYSYVNNRPLTFIDPTGHCGVDATQALIDQCIVERDQLSAYYNISFEGQWLLSEIRATKLSLQDMEAGLGGVKYFQAKFSGVILSRLAGTNSNTAKVEDFSTIKMWDNLFSQAIDHIRFTIIHEFGHIWDARSFLTQSIGLQLATGGNTEGLGCSTPAEVMIDSCTYRPQLTTVSGYSEENRREDWADSFAAVIYGGDWNKLTGHHHNINTNALTTAIDRINYVSGQIQQFRNGVDAYEANVNYYGYPSYIDPSNP